MNLALFYALEDEESGLIEITPLISTFAVEGWCPVLSHLGVSWWY